MDGTMTSLLIAAGSALLLVGAVSKHVWPRLKFWLALTQSAADRVPNRTGEQVFQNNLRSLATRTSEQRLLTPSKIAAPQLSKSAVRAGVVVR
jgi:hypothetical protein